MNEVVSDDPVVSDAPQAGRGLMNAPETQIDANDPLRIKVCPRCDYSLHMLPRRGVCPECGFAYDSETIYLYGWAAGTKAGLRNSTAGPLPAVLVPGFFALLFVVFFRESPGMVAVILIAFVLSVMGWLWRRYGQHGSGLVQVKLSPRGFHQGNRQLGPIPYERCATARFIPWSKGHYLLFDVLDKEKVHILIAPRNAWYKLHRDFIDAEVSCTLREYNSILPRINQWRANATQSAQPSPLETLKLSRFFRVQ